MKTINVLFIMWWISEKCLKNVFVSRSQLASVKVEFDPSGFRQWGVGKMCWFSQ